MAGATRSQTVLDQLRTMILQGELGPGEHMQELKLAKALGVSRTPVHDALMILANEGLLEYAPHCGHLVRRFDIVDVLDAFDVRMVLEAMACRLAAERGLPAEVATRLEEVLAQSETLLFDEAWNDRRQAEWFELNLAFHGGILRAADNRYLSATVSVTRAVPQVWDNTLAMPQETRRLYRREQSQQAHRDHVKIYSAIRRRQNIRAEALMKEHIFQNREDLEQNYNAFVGARAVAPRT